jgi:NADH:ubiquinone oxidoreductase subunit 4 (subunit M)
MGVATLAIFTFSNLGLEASIFLQIAHGLVSSALFILVTILYEHHHSRLVKYYRGVTLAMPLFSLLFIFFTLANIGVPLSSNFIGEFLSLLAAFGISTTVAILASTGMVLSACYALFLAGRVCFGQASPHLKLIRDIDGFQFTVLFILLFLTIFLGVYPNCILNTVSPSVHHMLIALT